MIYGIKHNNIGGFDALHGEVTLRYLKRKLQRGGLDALHGEATIRYLKRMLQRGGEHMAKVTGPLFSVDASGKLADSIVFSKWRGINTVRQWAKPANPDTEGQQQVRSNFQASVDDYHTLSGDDKQAWALSAFGQPLSGYNLFIGVSVKTKTEFDDFNFLRNVCTDYTVGGENETEIKVIPKYGGTAQILYGLKTDKLTNKVSIDLNAGVESSTFLTDLVENQEYYFKLVQSVETIGNDEIYGETGIYSFVHQIPVTEDNYVNVNYSIV